MDILYRYSLKLELRNLFFIHLYSAMKLGTANQTVILTSGPLCFPPRPLLEISQGGNEKTVTTKSICLWSLYPELQGVPGTILPKVPSETRSRRWCSYCVLFQLVILLAFPGQMFLWAKQPQLLKWFLSLFHQQNKSNQEAGYSSALQMSKSVESRGYNYSSRIYQCLVLWVILWITTSLYCAL